MLVIRFILTELFKVAILWTVLFFLGLLVKHKGVKVNYTRKAGHFGIFFLPVLFATYLPYPSENLTETATLMSMIFNTCTFLLFTEKIRNKSRFINTMFLAMDRPEDRPNTVKWLMTQLLAGVAVMTVNVQVYLSFGYEAMIILISPLAFLGDGFAEPVGIRFGRIKYKVNAIFSKKKYYRTLEGSLTVLVISALVILYFRGLFTTDELKMALLIIPVTITFAEAISPHTWDTPFLFAFGGATIFVVKHFF